MRAEGRQWRKRMSKTGLGLGGLIAAAFIGFGLMFWFGGNDVENFCREATPGLPYAQLAPAAEKHGLQLTQGPRDASGAYSLLAHTPRSYGRHTCMVRHDNQAVIDSRYQFSD